MEDGLGLVYEKQGNTGAAAYNQPYQDNTLNRLADQVNNERLYLRQQKTAKDKDRIDYNRKLLEFNPERWNIDNQMHFQKAINALQYEGARLHAMGYDLSDLTQPEVRLYHESRNNLGAAAADSKEQERRINEINKRLLAESADPNSPIDVQASSKALWEQYIDPEKHDPFSRFGKNPNDLFVYKEQPYDYLAPLDKFKIDPYVGSFGKDTPTGGASGSTLNKKNLRQDIDAIAYNPENNQHYETGVKKGFWDNRKEYADFLYENAERKYTPDYKTVVKAPKGQTLADLENGNSEELINKLGTGTQRASVPLFSVDEKPTGRKVNINLNNVIQLDNVDSDISWASASDANTGQQFRDKTGAFRLKSGAMALPLVRVGTNRILSPEDGIYKYIDKNGKEQVLRGTANEISQQLIKLGYAEYKPMIFGKALSKDKAGTAIEQDVWLPADAALHGTNDKNKSLSSGEYAYEIYKKRANDLNSGKVSNNTNIGKVVSAQQIKSLVGTKGYEGYTEQELIDYYKSLGYTIQ